MDNIRPTWGYHSDGSAQIFDLEGEDDLPEGWHDTPQTVKPASEDVDGEAAPDAVTARGIAAAKAGKPRTVPPAYRGKDEELRWLEGYDSQV